MPANIVSRNLGCPSCFGAIISPGPRNSVVQAAHEQAIAERVAAAADAAGKSPVGPVMLTIGVVGLIGFVAYRKWGR